MPFFSHDHIHFHYLDREAGAPVVLQHGLGGDVSQPTRLFEPPLPSLRVPDHRIGETLDVISRVVRHMIKPELVLDPSEPEIYTVAGKKLIVATVKPSHGQCIRLMGFIG